PLPPPPVSVLPGPRTAGARTCRRGTRFWCRSTRRAVDNARAQESWTGDGGPECGRPPSPQPECESIRDSIQWQPARTAMWRTRFRRQSSLPHLAGRALGRIGLLYAAAAAVALPGPATPASLPPRSARQTSPGTGDCGPSCAPVGEDLPLVRRGYPDAVVPRVTALWFVQVVR